MPRESELRVRATPGEPCPPSPRIVIVLGANDAIGIGHFPDTAEVITSEVVIRPVDLFALSEEPVAHHSARRVPLFAQLCATPQHPIITVGRAAADLGLASTPAQPVIGEEAAIRAGAVDLRDGRQPVGRIPLEIRDRQPAGDIRQVPVQIVPEALRGAVAQRDLIIMRHSITVEVRHLHPDRVDARAHHRIPSKIRPRIDNGLGSGHGDIADRLVDAAAEPQRAASTAVDQFVHVVVVRAFHDAVDPFTQSVPRRIVGVLVRVRHRAALQRLDQLAGRVILEIVDARRCGIRLLRPALNLTLGIIGVTEFGDGTPTAALIPDFLQPLIAGIPEIRICQQLSVGITHCAQTRRDPDVLVGKRPQHVANNHHPAQGVVHHGIRHPADPAIQHPAQRIVAIGDGGAAGREGYNDAGQFACTQHRVGVGIVGVRRRAVGIRHGHHAVVIRVIRQCNGRGEHHRIRITDLRQRIVEVVGVNGNLAHGIRHLFQPADCVLIRIAHRRAIGVGLRRHPTLQVMRPTGRVPERIDQVLQRPASTVLELRRPPQRIDDCDNPPQRIVELARPPSQSVPRRRQIEVVVHHLLICPVRVCDYRWPVPIVIVNGYRIAL